MAKVEKSLPHVSSNASESKSNNTSLQLETEKTLFRNADKALTQWKSFTSPENVPEKKSSFKNLAKILSNGIYNFYKFIGCIFFKSTNKYLSNGNVYKGEFKYGQYHGKGIISNKEGQSLFDGEFENGLYHGQGIKHFPNGDIYKGEFKQGQYHGNGTISNKNEVIIFEGEFKNGLYHGKGTISNKEGQLLFDGEFENGLYHGKGIKHLPDGDVYKGEFQKGQYHGKGTISNKEEQLLFDGEFENGQYHGKGIQYIPDGDIYKSEFQKGERHGKGIIFTNKGQQFFNGEFENDQYHGKGTQTFTNGDFYKGEFKQGQRHGNGTLWGKNGGMLFKGESENDLWHGNGTLWNKNGDLLFSGEFEKNIYHGKGITFDRDGKKIYEGEFKNGEYHGKGIIWDKNEHMLFNGEFANGQPHDRGSVYDKDFNWHTTYDKGILFTNEGIKVKFKEVNKETGLVMVTVHHRESDIKSGYEYRLTIDMNEHAKINLKQSVVIMPDGETFQGILGDDFELLQGTITDKKGNTKSIKNFRFDNGYLFNGGHDEQNRPHGRGVLTISGVAIIGVEFNHGQIVENSAYDLRIINSEKIKDYLPDHIPQEFLGIISGDLLTANKAVGIVQESGSEDHKIIHNYNRVDLIKWIDLKETDPMTREERDRGDIRPADQVLLKKLKDWVIKNLRWSELKLGSNLTNSRVVPVSLESERVLQQIFSEPYSKFLPFSLAWESERVLRQIFLEPYPKSRVLQQILYERYLKALVSLVTRLIPEE